MEEQEIKRKISHLSSRLYGDIRIICGTEGLTQNRLDEYIKLVTIARITLALSSGSELKCLKCLKCLKLEKQGYPF